MALQKQTRIGQPQVPGRALDQHRADRLLQPDKRPAHRGFRHPQRARRAGNAAEVGDAGKYAKVGEVEHGVRSIRGTV